MKSLEELQEELKTVPPAHDPVSRPAHYVRGGLEVIDIIEAFALGFRLANVVKYVLRSDSKGGLEDLKKARWYLDREISKRESLDG